MSDPVIVGVLMLLWPLLGFGVLVGFFLLVVKAFQAVDLLRSIDRSLKTLPSVQREVATRRAAGW